MCLAYSDNEEAPYVREHFAANRRDAGEPGAPAADPPKDALDFVHEVMFPAMGIKDGKRPDLATARARLSHLTFYAHSFGSVYAQEVSNTFRNELVKQGYAQGEAAVLAREVVTVAIANIARIDLPRPGFRTFSFAARFDATSYDAMKRIAGLAFGKDIPDLEARRDELYANAGYDPKLAHARNGLPEDPPFRPRKALLDQPKRQPNGFLVTSDLPGALAVIRQRPTGATETVIDRKFLRREYGALKMLGLDHSDIVPEHDLRMFSMPTESGNKPMVQQVDATLGNAVARGVTQDYDKDLRALIEHMPPALAAGQQQNAG